MFNGSDGAAREADMDGDDSAVGPAGAPAAGAAPAAGGVSSARAALAAARASPAAPVRHAIFRVVIMIPFSPASLSGGAPQPTVRGHGRGRPAQINPRRLGTAVLGGAD